VLLVLFFINISKTNTLKILVLLVLFSAILVLLIFAIKELNFNLI